MPAETTSTTDPSDNNLLPFPWRLGRSDPPPPPPSEPASVAEDPDPLGLDAIPLELVELGRSAEPEDFRFSWFPRLEDAERF